MTTATRRAVLAGIASAPVVDIWAPPVPDDPIFGLIQAHRVAYAAYRDICSGGDTEKREAEIDRIGEHADELAIELVNLEPTTLDGVLALLSYFVESTGKYRSTIFPDHLQEDDEHAGPIVRTYDHFIVRSASSALQRIVSAGRA